VRGGNVSLSCTWGQCVKEEKKKEVRRLDEKMCLLVVVGFALFCGVFFFASSSHYLLLSLPPSFYDAHGLQPRCHLPRLFHIFPLHIRTHTHYYLFTQLCPSYLSLPCLNATQPCDFAFCPPSLLLYFQLQSPSGSSTYAARICQEAITPTCPFPLELYLAIDNNRVSAVSTGGTGSPSSFSPSSSTGTSPQTQGGMLVIRPVPSS
jgi:hypothetical protein